MSRWRPTWSAIVNAPILEEDRALVVDAAEGRSFQAMLALGALPEESEFPGSRGAAVRAA